MVKRCFPSSMAELESSEARRFGKLCDSLCAAATEVDCSQVVVAIPCAKDCVLVRVVGGAPDDVGNRLTSSYGFPVMFCTDDQLLVDPDLDDYLFNYGKVIYDRELTACR